MRILCGILLLLFCGGHFANAADANKTATQGICEICNCNVTAPILNCANENLFKLFNVNEWIAVKNGSNSVTLTNVDFGENGIEVVTQFPELDIKSLSFRHNKIHEIESRAFKNLSMLEKLDLSENHLTIQSLRKDVFEGNYNSMQYEPLKNLKWLSLAGNDLHAVIDDAFDHLPNLETLILCHNQFKVIDPNSASAISVLTNLKVLDLSFMELRELPNYMLHAPRHLRVLNLTGNLFTSIPDAIHSAENLIELIIDDVPIEYIGGNYSRFPRLPKLEKLSISYMSTLKGIDAGAFQNLSALQHFYACHNRHLSSIHPHAFANSDVELQAHVEWPPLQSLFLHSNNLSVISEKLIDRWEELTEIDLRYNPWKCACENQWIVNKLIPLMKNISQANPHVYLDMKCAEPYEMKGQSFLEITAKNEHMRCEDFYGRRPERDGPILVGIFIGLMIGIPLTMAAIFVYKRGCFGIFGYRPGPADYGRAFYKRTELREDLHI